MSINRHYRCSNIEMCLASQTIAGNFRIHLAELATKRTNWTTEYADDLEARIKGIMKDVLGLDPKIDLRAATETLSKLMGPAKRDLSFFKAEIDQDLKKEPAIQKEYLRILGFTKNLQKVQHNDQEALIELLFSFGKNMSEAIKTKITSKGMIPESIDQIIAYAETIDMANVEQEKLKKSTNQISADARKILNDLYDEIIGICHLAANYYQYESLKKEQFTFSKIVSAMNFSGKKPVLEEEDA